LNSIAVIHLLLVSALQCVYLVNSPEKESCNLSLIRFFHQLNMILK